MESPERHAEFFNTFGNLSTLFPSVENVRTEIIQGLATAKGQSSPAKLHHYTNSAGINGIILSNHLWATDFRNLNDTTELTYGTGLLVDELKKFGKEKVGDVSILLNGLCTFYMDHGDKIRDFFETYVVSLSEAPDMLSQWRAYADHAKGCCVEFDFTDSRLFTIVDEYTPWALEILPVIYDEDIQRSLIRSGIERLLNHLSPLAINRSTSEQGILIGFLMHALRPFVTAFKHPGFAEEREWRAIAACQKTQTDAKKKQRIAGSSSSNYLECIFIQGNDVSLWQRKLLPITGIKYGPLAEPSKKEEIRKLLSLNGYENQVVYSDSSIPLRA